MLGDNAMSRVNVDSFLYDLHDLPIPSASPLSLEALLTQSGGPCSGLHSGPRRVHPGPEKPSNWPKITQPRGHPGSSSRVS